MEIDQHDHEGVVPPSANWYCSHVSQCHDNGVYAFGGRNDILLYQLIVGQPDQMDGQLAFIGILSLHHGRVTCLQLSRNGVQRLCVSGGEDKKIVLWDIDSKNYIAKHEKHQVSLLQ